MPGISGVELLKELRADPETETLPVILLSALSTVEDKISGLKAGADEYLTKPIDPRASSSYVSLRSWPAPNACASQVLKIGEKSSPSWASRVGLEQAGWL